MLSSRLLKIQKSGTTGPHKLCSTSYPPSRVRWTYGAIEEISESTKPVLGEFQTLQDCRVRLRKAPGAPDQISTVGPVIWGLHRRPV